MSQLTLIIPVPPSTNGLFFNRGRGRVKTEAYRKWREQAGWHAREAYRLAGKPQIEGPLSLTIRLGIDHRRDVSNCVKPIEDMLCEALPGLPDDRFNDELIVQRDRKIMGRVEVVISSLAPPP